MQKLVKRISLVMVALMTVFTALSYVPAKAATVVPKVQFVGVQATEFTAGERVTFNLNAANYGGRVQYRVVLWNDATKSYKDLWNTADRYYTNWMPYGNETLPLGWVINEPGTYRITVYAKRAGLANSKTALKGMNCDSYLNGPAFVVKPAATTPESIAPVADVSVNEGATPVLPAEVTLKYANNVTKTAKVTWAAVDTTKVGTVAVEGTVEGTTLKAKVNVTVVAVPLVVESVTAINSRQLEVKFNKNVDDVTGTYLGNYYIQLNGDINPVAITGKDALVEVEFNTGNVATFTFSGEINTKLAINAGTPFNFIVSGIKDLNGTTMQKATVRTVANDTTAPTYVSSKAAAKTTTTVVTLTFSEPINPVGAIVYVNGKAATVQAGSTLNTLKVTAADNLDAGKTYNVTILNAQDFALNFINPNPVNTTVSVTQDATAPVSGDVKVVGDKLIEVTFDKSMDVSSFIGNVTLVANTGAQYTGVITPSAKPGTSSKVIKLTLSVTALAFDANGVWTGTLHINNNVADIYGNKLPVSVKSVTVSKDTVKPVFASAKYIVPGTVYTDGLAYANGAIVLKFNENVANQAIQPQLIASNGALITVATVLGAPVDNTGDSTEIIIPVAAGQSLAAGTYTIMVPSLSVKDLSWIGNANDAVTSTVTVSSNGDVTKPAVNPALGAVTPATTLASGTKIAVKMTDNTGLDLVTVINPYNYLLNGLPLPAGTYVTVAANTGDLNTPVDITATLNIPAGSIKADASDYVLNVLNIKDKAGNVANPVAFTAITLKDDIAPSLTEAKIAANGTLLLGFSESVTTAAAANLVDFNLTINGVQFLANNAAVSVVSGVGTDAGKYVITVAGVVDNGADNTAATAADNRLFIDINGNGTYEAGTDILVKTGTTTTPGATTVNLNEVSGLRVSVVAIPAVVKDLSTVLGGYVIKTGTDILVK